jgi:hypothetical protein
VVKSTINHPQITINRWYKPSNMGWFIIVLPSLMEYLLEIEIPDARYENC